MPAAVVFDLDGVLIDSEQVWDAVRRAYVGERCRTWAEDSTARMQGMSTPEWSAYLVDGLGVPGPPQTVAADVVRRVADRYGQAPPLLPGAVEAVRALADRWPCALASSSPPDLVRAVLTAAGLLDRFGATVSSEEVARGKPAPDVYLEAARRLGVAPADCVAVEDSDNGLRSAAAAGMTVVATPNVHYPPPADALALAAVVLPGVAALTPEVVAAL